MNIATIRQWQMQKMRLNFYAISQIMTRIRDDEMTRFRDGGGGWTVLEVLCHLRDFEAVFLDRAKVTVEGDNPVLPFPDPDALAEAQSYNTQDWREALAIWQERRDAYIAYLAACAESDWERPAQHPKRGPFTLHDQLFLHAFHDTVHLEQMMRILAEQRTG